MQFIALFILFVSGAHVVRCLAAGCACEIGSAVLRGLVGARALGTLLRRAQAAELRAAGVDAQLDSCPFCDFAMIIDNPHERIFRCQNTDCLRESCR